LATEDERIAELVEMIANANGTKQALALTRELNTLLEARKKLQFTSMEPGKPMTARCVACKQSFLAVPKIGEKGEDTSLRIRLEFETHICAVGGASQTVVRG
jgi:hypothetical protein